MAKREVFVRNPYNYDVEKASKEAGLACDDPSLTLQSQAQEADINVILKRLNVTGVLPQASRVPTYGDFSAVVDYRGALDLIRAADAAFMSVPADVRARFSNDPAAFVEFCSNEANIEEVRRLGLAPPAKPAAAAAAAEGGSVSARRDKEHHDEYHHEYGGRDPKYHKGDKKRAKSEDDA